MRILAVGADAILQETLVQIALQTPCEEMLSALNFPAAHALISDRRKASFDLITFDLDAPGADALAFVEDVRRQSGPAETPILGLTAGGDEDRIDDAFAAGMSDFLVKPFSVNGLYNHMTRLIAAERGRRAAHKEIDCAPLAAPFKIDDVAGCIAAHALDHYVQGLSRRSLFHASAVAFAVRNIEDIYEGQAPDAFRRVITDVSVAISNELHPHRALFAYAGDGIFVSVFENAPQLQTERLMHRINTRLAHSRTTAAGAKISTGSATRLTWRSGRAVSEALREARANAAQARLSYQTLQKQFWYMERSA